VTYPEFFCLSVDIKGCNRFKKADYFRQLQLTALESEISLPLFVWSDDPNKYKRKNEEQNINLILWGITFKRDISKDLLRVL
jgi:hypothetical protein